MKPTDTSIVLKKTDDEWQVVWGEVYAPMVPDSQGDFMTADEIRKALYAYMRSNRLGQIDVNHDNRLYGCWAVEMFIARDDDSIFIPGSWVAGVHIPSPDLWAKVKSGELNGFSMEILAVRSEATLEMVIPDVLTGLTEITDGHDHSFQVTFDDDGNFAGGQTNTVAGHSHPIRRGTATEEVNGHTHRFSYVEGLIDAQDPG